MSGAMLSGNADPSGDAWTWWQGHRFRYNRGLAAAGWLAYFIAVGQSFAFGRPMWQSLFGAFGMTLFLGAAFLVLMGLANIFFLLGPVVETTAQPADRDGFRDTAWRLGFWGSVAVPFLFPLINLAILIGHGA